MISWQAFAQDSSSIVEQDVPWQKPSASTADYAGIAGNGVSGLNGSALTLQNGQTLELPQSTTSGGTSCQIQTDIVCWYQGMCGGSGYTYLGSQGSCGGGDGSMSKNVCQKQVCTSN